MAGESVKRQVLAEQGIELLKRLIEENTSLTQQVEALTREIHGTVVSEPGAAGR